MQKYIALVLTVLTATEVYSAYLNTIWMQRWFGVAVQNALLKTSVSMLDPVPKR